MVGSRRDAYNLPRIRSSFMPATSVLDIDLAAVRRNVRRIRSLLRPDARFGAVLKAEAYGLGAQRIGRIMAEEGAAMGVVYTAEQGRDLESLADQLPLLVLMPFASEGGLDTLSPLLRRQCCHLTVHEPGHVTAVIRTARRLGVRIPVHLEVDTGMTRGGCAYGDAPHLLERVAGAPELLLSGIASHFAAADSDPQRTADQAARFEDLLERSRHLITPQCHVHLANTCGTLRSKAYHHGMVRIGQGWAGLGIDQLGSAALPGALHLQPVVRWRTRIILVRDVVAGTAVGYSARWRAPGPTRIALIPVGYAEGYPRALGTDPDAPQPARVGVDVAVGGRMIRVWSAVVGVVNMDQITIDLGDLHGSDGLSPLSADETAVFSRLIGPGTAVELVGPVRSAPNHLAALARRARTAVLEVLSGLLPRHARTYLDDPPQTRAEADAPLVGAEARHE